MDWPALLTPEEFSTRTGGKVRADDPRVPPLLDGATSGVRRYCGWHVAPVLTETMVLDGPGGRVLALPTLRLVSVRSVTETTRPGAPVPLADGEDFEWSANGELRHLHRAWTARWRALALEVGHGFDDASDLVQVVQQVVANAVASPLGATVEQAGVYSVRWATTAPGVSGGMSLLARDLAVLDSYRLPAVPS